VEPPGAAVAGDDPHVKRPVGVRRVAAAVRSVTTRAMRCRDEAVINTYAFLQLAAYRIG
jgi:hypothetical protein